MARWIVMDQCARSLVCPTIWRWPGEYYDHKIPYTAPGVRVFVHLVLVAQGRLSGKVHAANGPYLRVSYFTYSRVLRCATTYSNGIPKSVQEFKFVTGP